MVNDGSKDGTLQRADRRLRARARSARPSTRRVPHKPIRGLYGSPRPARLLVVDKENGGKADALNAGINLSRAPIFCAIDADSILEPDALLRAVRPFIEEPDRTVAVGGTIRIANGCRIENGRVVERRPAAQPARPVPDVEYLRAFLMARLAWSRIKTLTHHLGRLRAVPPRRRGRGRRLSATSTVGEDFELVVKLHRHMRDHGEDYRDRVHSRAGLLDRGAREPDRPRPPAQPLAARRAGDLLAASGHAVQPALRPDRLARLGHMLLSSTCSGR